MLYERRSKPERERPEPEIWGTELPTLERVDKISRMTATHQAWGATCPIMK